MKNIFKHIAFVLMLECIGIVMCMDPRSHVSAGGGSITDEGFRWRDSLNFNVDIANAGAIPVPVWYFDDGTGQGFELHRRQADGIHIALSNIVRTVHGLGQGITHVAAAAITIVVQNPNTGGLEAYSKIVKEDLVNNNGNVISGPAVSIPALPHNSHLQCGTILNTGISMYYTNTKVPQNAANTKTHVENSANTLIGANIPIGNGIGNGYGCCEGQIITRLFDTNPPNGIAVVAGAIAPNPMPVATALFPSVITDLIQSANLPANHGGQAPVNAITPNHIVLVVLHIHSYYDPCAKCSKVLSGLSRQMNMPAAMAGANTQTQAMTNLLNGFNTIANLIANLRSGAARFLIEVSSEREYLYQGNRCSFAELSGHDSNAANPVTISVNPNIPTATDFANAANQKLSIPNGIGNQNNWSFPSTFPPYVVYGRINAGAIMQAPESRCNDSNNHNTTLTLPLPLRPTL